MIFLIVDMWKKLFYVLHVNTCTCEKMIKTCRAYKARNTALILIIKLNELIIKSKHFHFTGKTSIIRRYTEGMV